MRPLLRRVCRVCEGGACDHWRGDRAHRGPDARPRLCRTLWFRTRGRGRRRERLRSSARERPAAPPRACLTSRAGRGGLSSRLRGAPFCETETNTSAVGAPNVAATSRTASTTSGTRGRRGQTARKGTRWRRAQARAETGATPAYALRRRQPRRARAASAPRSRSARR